MSTDTVGKRGEQLAALYLEQNGYHVLHQNYRHGHQEIDIVATDDVCVVFCEVSHAGRIDKCTGGNH